MFGKRKTKKTTSRLGQLHLERLEDRTLLTGNVLAVLGPDGGNPAGLLHITGDIGNNAITIESASVFDKFASPNAIGVIGDTGSLTTVNGANYAEFDINTVASIQVDYLNGKDSVKLLGPFPLLLGGLRPVMGNITVNAGTGADTYVESNVDANIVTLKYAGKVTATLTSDKIGALMATSKGADVYSLTSDSIGTANISAGAGSSVTIGGAGSKIGSLTSNQAAGADSFSMTGTSLSQAFVTEGTGAKSLTVTGNSFLNTASFSVSAAGTLGSPAAVTVSGNKFTNGPVTLTVGNGPTPGAVNVMAVHFDSNTDGDSATVKVGNNYASVTADGNTVSKNLSVTAGTNVGSLAPSSVEAKANTVGGNLSVTDGDNNASIVADSNVSVGGNLSVTAGNNAGTVSASNNAKVGGALTVKAGNGAGTINVNNDGAALVSVTAGNGAGTVNVNGDTVATDINVTVGTGAGTVNVNNDTAGGGLNLAVGVGSTAVNVTGDSFGEDAFINVGLGGAAEAVTISNDTFDEATINIGNGATVTMAFDNVSDADADGDGNMSLTVGTGSASVSLDHITTAWNLAVAVGTGATSFSLMNSSIGNDASITVAEAAADFVTTELDSDTFGDNLFMNLGAGSGASNIVLIGTQDGINPDGPVTVGNQLLIFMSNGVNALATANLSCFFGDIWGGTSGANTYFDLGGNFGYAVHQFVGFGS